MADPSFAAPIQPTGDVTSLPLGSQIVTALQGRNVSGAAPSAGQVLAWSAASKQWAPSVVNAVQLQGNAVKSGAPSGGQVLEWIAANSDWEATYPPGYEIGYDQITAPVAITGTVIASSTTVIAGSSHTFDGGAVMVEFFSPVVSAPSVVGGAITIVLFEGGTAIGQLAQIINPAAAELAGPVAGKKRFTPTAGSHTYSAEAYVSSTTGTPQVFAGTDGTAYVAAYLRFTKV